MGVDQADDLGGRNVLNEINKSKSHIQLTMEQNMTGAIFILLASLLREDVLRKKS